MYNIYAIRLFIEDFGDIIEVVETFNKISKRMIIAEEMKPYQHYHIMMYSDKTLKQVKKFISNHTPKYDGVFRKERRRRMRNNTNCQVVEKEKAYYMYMLKDFTRAFDTSFGWLNGPEDYKYDFEDLEPETQHFWEQKSIEEQEERDLNEIRGLYRPILYNQPNNNNEKTPL